MNVLINWLEEMSFKLYDMVYTGEDAFCFVTFVYFALPGDKLKKTNVYSV